MASPTATLFTTRRIGTNESFDLATVQTPLAQMLYTHIQSQCAPFVLQYNNALELGAARSHQLIRKQRVGFCMDVIQKKLNTKCSNRVLNFQNAVSELATGETPDKVEALKEAEGRLQFCARYPHRVDRDAVNERPLSYYFRNPDVEGK